MVKLEKIYLSHTDVDSGLDDLPESCQELYCDFNYRDKHKSLKIAKELGRYLEESNDELNTKYYNLARWKEDKRNNIALSIETDKLYTIRSEIENFYSEWDEERIKNLEKNDKISLIKIRANNFIQWTNRIASVGGGGLLLVGANQSDDYYTQTGGIIAIVSPFVEVVTSSYGDSLRQENEIRWEEFAKDAKRLWNVYSELLYTLPDKIPTYPGKVNDALKDLKEKFYNFFKEYDTDGNHDFDENELEKLQEQEKKKFPQKLKDNWKVRKKELDEIRKALKNLEKEVKNYRDNFFFGVKERSQNITENNTEMLEMKKGDLLLEEDLEIQEIVEVNEYFETKYEQQTQIEIPLK